MPEFDVANGANLVPEVEANNVCNAPEVPVLPNKWQLVKAGFVTGLASAAGGLAMYGSVVGTIKLTQFVVTKIKNKKGEKPNKVDEE